MKTPTIEKLLAKQHGDLHELIPQMVNEKGQSKTADELGVHQGWISRWLNRNGYRQVIQWVKEDGAA
jgi:DNA invertase Pin-like site-specific DNA recombinase